MKIQYIYLYTFFLSILLLSSCNRSDNKLEITSNTREVSSKQLPIETLLGNPYQITINSGILTIADTYEGKTLILYDINAKKSLGRYLTVGQGPNEVIAPLLLSRTSETNVLSVLQRQNGKFTQYDINELVKNNVVPQKEVKFENTDRILVANDKYITEGDYKTGSLNFFDSSPKVLNTVNIYPEYIQKLNAQTNKYVYGQGHILYNSKTNTLAFASYFTGELGFYTVKNNDLEETKFYDLGISSMLKNRISNTSENANLKPSDIEYFSDAYNTNDAFYLLYTGLPMSEKKDADFSYIAKFSTNGNFIETYKTDKKILSFCISNDNKMLYAVALTKDHEYVLVEIAI